VRKEGMPYVLHGILWFMPGRERALNYSAFYRYVSKAFCILGRGRDGTKLLMDFFISSR
jgi:hypothetical protein